MPRVLPRAGRLPLRRGEAGRAAKPYSAEEVGGRGERHAVMGRVIAAMSGHDDEGRWLATVDAIRAELTKLKVELVGLRAGAYNRGKVDAFEEAARAIEPDVWLIYTGPGGFDPEHLQKQGAERIRFLADRERDFDLAEEALKNPRRIPHNELRKELGLGQEDPSSASPPTEEKPWWLCRT